MLTFFKRGFYCSGVSSYTEGAEGGTLDWAVNKVGGNDKELKDKNNQNTNKTNKTPLKPTKVTN